MNLTFEQIMEITTGAVDSYIEDGMLHLRRFTPEQMELYRNGKESFYNKTFTLAGMKLMFKTDSKNLFMKFKTEYANSRRYFSIDVFVNGKLVDCIDNFSDVEIPPMYTTMDLPLGKFSKNFCLGDGDKTVCVYLPWSTKTLFEEISVDDNSYVEAIKPEKKLLVFGDSITQGYDALRPSNRYATKIADLLCAEEYNKAIGGEKFKPELPVLKESFTPDYILVAYGSNDWFHRDAETFRVKCKGFFENLVKTYPDIKIFAVTPIWRKDMVEERKFGDFNMVDPLIRDCVKDIENISVISGFDFVPKDEKYFADLRLHPNDEGFKYQAENLSKEIKKIIWLG